MSLWPLLLLLLLALCAPLGAARESRYQKFLRQHQDAAPPAGGTGGLYCATFLRRRNVNGPGLPCKPVNTVVHAPAADLVAPCAATAGMPPGTLRATAAALDLTVCRATGGSVRYPCAYRSVRRRQRVEVACDGGLPVHLSRTF